VQNARAALGLRKRYDLEGARRLGLARLLSQATHMPLRRAYGVAGKALQSWPERKEWAGENPDGSVRIVVDVERYLSAFATRLSLSRTYYLERRRGRPPNRVREPIAAAKAYGVDVSLLQESLKLTPEERVQRLDENVTFLKSVRVVGP